MTKSQNTKNEQQKDLCITSEQLTAQWKKGELPAGRYWVKYRSGRIDDWDLLGGKTIETKPEIVEVLAEVPDYNLWQNLWNTADMEHKANNKLLEDVERLKKENKELKKQVNHLSKTQARQFVDNQKLQVKAEKAKDVVDIEAARKIKELERELKKCVKTCTPLQITLILSLTLKICSNGFTKFTKYLKGK